MTIKRQSKVIAKPANDNVAVKGDGPAVACDFENNLAILPGEAELIARFLGNVQMSAANDNEE